MLKASFCIWNAGGDVKSIETERDQSRPGGMPRN